jgi:hypothetical protein
MSSPWHVWSISNKRHRHTRVCVCVCVQVLCKLLPIKNSLTDFEYNVNEVRSEIIELLDDNSIDGLCQPVTEYKVHHNASLSLFLSRCTQDVTLMVKRVD